MPHQPIFEPHGTGIQHPDAWHAAAPSETTLGAGDLVYAANGKALCLGGEIGAGSGEGRVFQEGGISCVKLLRAASNTRSKQEKIQTLCELQPVLTRADRGIALHIALPSTPVYADAKRTQMLGYRMPFFAGYRPLMKLHSRPSKSTPSLMPLRDRVKLACHLCEIAVFAERNHLFLGDVLTPYNILYAPQTLTVKLIDLDSIEFTYGGITYPARVGRNDCYAPEHISDDAESVTAFPRTPADDRWSLQLVLFYILLGCEPYARIGAGRLADDTRAGAYAFPRANPVDHRNYQLPPGLAERMRVLPAGMQEAFFEAFSGDGAHFHAADRVSAAVWLAHMQTFAESWQTNFTKKGD